MARQSSASPQASEQSPLRTHEKRDISMKLIVGVLIFIVFSALVIHSSLWGWLSNLPQGTHQRFSSQWQVLAPGAAAREVPALQVKPQDDLKRFEQQCALRLRSYGWIDPQAGVIQLPIERAMQLIAEEGLPHWQPAAARFTLSGPGGGDPKPDIDAAFLKRMAQDSAATIPLIAGAGGEQASAASGASSGHAAVAGPSPLQLQQQRAHPPKEGDQAEPGKGNK
jgi:hypothetical protein